MKLQNQYSRLRAGAIAMVLAAVSVSAQEPMVSADATVTLPGVMSLDSCRAMALTNNKQLMMARQRVKKAEYQHKEAFAAYLPAIDFAGGYLLSLIHI